MLLSVASLLTVLSPLIPTDAASLAPQPQLRALAKNDGLNVTDPAGFISCTVCAVLVVTLQDLVQKNGSEEEIVRITKAICVDFKIEDERVCTGISREYKDMVVGVLSDVVLDPTEVCGFLLGNSCAHAHNPFDESWTIPLLNTPKPPYAPPIDPVPGSPVSRFMQVWQTKYVKVKTSCLG